MSDGPRYAGLDAFSGAGAVPPLAVAAALLVVATPGGAEIQAQQEPGTWRISPEPEIEAGGPGAAADELFTRIAGAVCLEDGRYVVADGGELRLSIHGPEGKRMRTIGSEGQGPGEFRWISGLWRTGGDTIGVWDGRLNRLTWLRPDGEVVRTARPTFGEGGPPPGVGSLDMFLGAFEDGGVGLAWVSAGRRSGGGRSEGALLPDRMAFGLFGASGDFRKLLGHATGMVRSFGPRGGGPIAFSPFPWAAVVGDTLVYTNGLEGRLRFYDPAAADSGAVRELTVQGSEIGLDEARHAVEEVLEEAPERTRKLAALSRADVTAGRVPAHGRMLADGAGRLWLKAYDPTTDPLAIRPGRFATGGEWTVVRTDGTVVARVDMPDDVAPLAVKGDLLLGLARDELGVERFVVHRIVR